MGILNLYDVIKEHAPEQILTFHLSELRGMSLAVDVSVFLYKYVRSAGPTGWVSVFVLFLCTLKKWGIKAVCIFDGDHQPEEKKGEQEKRRAQTKKTLDRLAECRKFRDHLERNVMCEDNPKMTTNDISTSKQLISPKRGTVDITDYTDPESVYTTLCSVIERLHNQTLPITKEYSLVAQRIVRYLGLKVIVSHTEAETICAYLCIKGQVDGVLTEDTDVLAYGTPLMFMYKDFKLGDNKIHGINLETLLNNLELSQKEFTDLCILLSCDYNTRVKGFPPDGRKRKKPIGIGCKGAWSVITACRDLDNADDIIPDITPLNHHRCRELFSVPDVIENISVPRNKEPKYSRLEKLFRKYKCSLSIDYIRTLHKPVDVVI